MTSVNTYAAYRLDLSRRDVSPEWRDLKERDDSDPDDEEILLERAPAQLGALPEPEELEELDEITLDFSVLRQTPRYNTKICLSGSLLVFSVSGILYFALLTPMDTVANDDKSLGISVFALLTLLSTICLVTFVIRKYCW